MKRIDQTIMHDPTNGKIGNCWQATLAMLLGLPLDAVPHFAHQFEMSSDAVEALNGWLRPMGMAFIELTVPPDGTVRDWLKSLNISSLHHELTGPSPRHSDARHAVACIDGMMFHDPHPDKTGLLPSKKAGDTTIGVIVLLDPAQFIKLQDAAMGGA